ncbi:MAG: class I SAM-dependent methyltransferase [Acidobacteriota bacterium]
MAQPAAVSPASKAAAPSAYTGYPFQQTHPDRLAVLAMLFGLQPAAGAAFRMREFGCGDGGNLIPMAFAVPESRFTGIDLASNLVDRLNPKKRQLQNHLGGTIWQLH